MKPFWAIFLYSIECILRTQYSWEGFSDSKTLCKIISKQILQDKTIAWRKEVSLGRKWRSKIQKPYKASDWSPSTKQFLYHWKNKRPLQAVFCHLSMYICFHWNLDCLSLRGCLNSRVEFKEVLSASSEKVIQCSDLLLEDVADVLRTAPQLQSILRPIYSFWKQNGRVWKSFFDTLFCFLWKNWKNMGEEYNTKTSYSQMFKLRIHPTENEQKPFNGNLQESVTHWVTCYLLILASILLSIFLKFFL